MGRGNDSRAQPAVRSRLSRGSAAGSRAAAVVAAEELSSMVSRLVRRFLDALRWRTDALRERALARARDRRVCQVKRNAQSVIDLLATMKAANPGRPFCGILLIEHIGDIVACEPVIAQERASHPN